MCLLDLARFDRILKVVGLRVRSVDTGRVLKQVKNFVLRRQTVKNVVATSANERVILLDPEKVPSKSKLDQVGILPAILVQEMGIEAVDHSVQLSYKDFTADQVLRELLPADCGEIPSSFEVAGHVAHLNLREEHLPFKSIIGRVLLDKNPSIRSVVNKTANITNKFRTFPLEILAGTRDLNVQVKQGSATFRFDFSKVYWNSRLHREHELLVERFAPNQVVVDAFCGVGPFAIPAAMKGCLVYANDLNPESFRALKENALLNKVSLKDLANTDAREYIRTMARSPNLRIDHVVMNLPATALEFLDAFRGAFLKQAYVSSVSRPCNEFNKRPRGDEEKLRADLLPMIHCYCFSKEEDFTTDVIRRAEAAIGCKLEKEAVEVRKVRDVAPKKWMLCAHFRVPWEIAFPLESE